MKRIFILFLLAQSLYSGDINSFFESMKKQEEQYKDKNISNNTKESLVKKLNISTENNDSKEHNKVIETLDKNSKDAINKSIPWISKSMMNGGSQEHLQTVVDSITQTTTAKEKVDTIFYLFSTSLTEYSFYNFVSVASKLERANKGIKYYGVVQGILNETELDKLHAPFKFEKTLGEKAIIKMHPLMFRDLELKRVPAYLFSKCSVDEFKYKECENKFLVRGDISLHKALEIVTQEDKSYLKYLNLLEKGEH